MENNYLSSVNFNWVTVALISAIAFALADFNVVVYAAKIPSKTLFVVYTILMAVILLFYVGFDQSLIQEISNLTTPMMYRLVFISILFLVAYVTHFKAISTSVNPGYANAIVMLHVAFLSLLSYWFLDRPLNNYAVTGIILMFVGAVMVSNQETVS